MIGTGGSSFGFVQSASDRAINWRRRLAHMIIPRSFYWEANVDGRFERGLRSQDIDELSSRLAAAGFQHRLTDLILEIKLY